MKTIKWTVIIIVLLFVEGYYVSFWSVVEAKTDCQNRFLNSAHEKVFLLIEDPDINAFSDPLGKNLNVLIADRSKKLTSNEESPIWKEILLADSSVMLAQGTELGQETPPTDTIESPDSGESEDYLEEDYFEDEVFEDELFGDDDFQDAIPDPFEPVNRFFFKFNDKMYFWVLRPVAKGYSVILPSPARTGVRNFFSNLAFPIRFVNCILQGKFIRASEELGLFIVNSTAGIAGVIDYSDKFGYQRQEEDFGQTLGVYGWTPGFYICWPIFGPSSFRDTFGLVGDIFLDPFTYITIGAAEYLAVRTVDVINDASLTIGDYEALIDASLDPYIAMRNAYQQYRESKINK